MAMYVLIEYTLKNHSTMYVKILWWSQFGHFSAIFEDEITIFSKIYKYADEMMYFASS